MGQGKILYFTAGLLFLLSLSVARTSGAIKDTNMEPRRPLNMCSHFIELVCAYAQNRLRKIPLQRFNQIDTQNKVVLAVPDGLKTIS